MALAHVERLDHLGLIASLIKDVGLIDMIDTRLVPDEQEEITPGEAMAGMILNGLGFANRPLSLTPQFFANKPLDLLFRKGVRAEMFNRFKLGRTLEEVYAYGCDLLFSELAVAVCVQEGIELRFQHLDTTSFSLSGDYRPDSDEQAITITHGYSKDHRPDLKQAVLELLVSQDGGVPLVSKSWDGNASDTQIFQERAEALMKTFKRSPTPCYLVADSKLYNEDNAPTLSQLGFITPIPGGRSRWCRRSSGKPSSGTCGNVSTTPPAIAVSSCVTTAWRSVGWWCRRRRPLSGRTPASTKRVSANLQPSKSNSFTCKPNGLKRLKPLKAPSRHWRHHGAIIRWPPRA